MDFFGHQEKAKTKTFWLFLLFILGLITLSVITTYAINRILLFTLEKKYHPVSLAQVLVPFVAIIFLVTLYKYYTLRGGGKAVAVSLGGRLIDKKAANYKEKQLLNIIEEMAIAASLPVPPVYILDNELNINAFAAGFTINDAVIGVTSGTLLYLTRDELQAVIGHEFSHILNGDMRLSLRFTSLLYGFLYLTQIAKLLLRIISESRASEISDKRVAGFIFAAFFICCLLVVAGWLGQLWARIMQAAINRQREFLADASSVQFTRHGPALASALKKIGGNAGGSTLEVDSARIYNHLFFGQSDTNLFATHPSLEERIKRIEPRWNGKYITPIIDQEALKEITQNPTQGIYKKALVGSMLINAAINANKEAIPYVKPVTLLNTKVTEEKQALAKLEEICQEPMDACYFIFALLLDKDPTISIKQLAIIKKNQLVIDYQQTLAIVPINQHLDFIEKAIPTLKQLSEKQYKDFQKIMMHFINADSVISLFEWLIYQLIIHQVGAQYNKNLAKPAKYTQIKQVKQPIQTLLSAVAWLSSSDETIKRAFGLGANIMGLYTIHLEEKQNIANLTTSLKELQNANEAIKKKFLKGVARAIELDKLTSPEEVMFLHTLSLCLDCPVLLPKN